MWLFADDVKFASCAGENGIYWVILRANVNCARFARGKWYLLASTWGHSRWGGRMGHFQRGIAGGREAVVALGTPAVEPGPPGAEYMQDATAVNP